MKKKVEVEEEKWKKNVWNFANKIVDNKDWLGQTKEKFIKNAKLI